MQSIATHLVTIGELKATYYHAIAEYEYNGLGYRIRERSQPIGSGAGSWAEDRRLFYNPSWQLVEERIDDSPTGTFTPGRASQQFWGLRSIGDAVMNWVDDTVSEGTGTEGDMHAPQTIPGGACATKNGYTADAYFYITKHQFSPPEKRVALLDAAGELVERIAYDAYDAYGNARHHYRHDVYGGSVGVRGCGTMACLCVSNHGLACMGGYMNNKFNSC